MSNDLIQMTVASSHFNEILNERLNANLDDRRSAYSSCRPQMIGGPQLHPRSRRADYVDEHSRGSSLPHRQRLRPGRDTTAQAGVVALIEHDTHDTTKGSSTMAQPKELLGGGVVLLGIDLRPRQVRDIHHVEWHATIDQALVGRLVVIL